MAQSSTIPAGEIESNEDPAPSGETNADPKAEMDKVFLQVGDALSQIKSTPLPLASDSLASAFDNASSACDTIATLANTWEPLLTKLKMFSSLVDKVAEVRSSTVISKQ